MGKFENKDPRDIIARCLILEQLRTVPPELILQLPARYHSFVRENKVSIIIVGKDKNPTKKYEINWEYALFQATQKLLFDLFEWLDKKPKDEKNTEPSTS